MPIVISPHFTIPDTELTERFTSSGGPGGQHANKAATRVELTWNIADSVVITDTQRVKLVAHFGPIARIVADGERSQLRNRETAEQRLADRVKRALAPVRARRATKPTRGSQRRRVDSKRKNSQRKQLRQRPNIDD